MKLRYPTVLLIGACCLLHSFIFAQTKIQEEQVASAFKASYALEKDGKYQKALDTLKQFYTLNAYETNLRLGYLYYLNGKNKESLDMYERAISQMNSSVEARLGYVLPASAMEKWDLVEKKYLEILELDASNTLVMYRLGLMNYYRKEYTKAEKYFSSVLKLYPFDYSSNLMLGWTNYFLGRKDEAKNNFKKTLMILPSDTSAINGLGLIKRDLNIKK